MASGGLLNLVASQLVVRLGELRQPRLIIHLRLHFEGTSPAGHIRHNIDDPVNLLQIASNRGGTSASRHVGDCERNQRVLRRSRVAHSGCRHVCGIAGVGRRRIDVSLATEPSTRQATAQKHK